MSNVFFIKIILTIYASKYNKKIIWLWEGEHTVDSNQTQVYTMSASTASIYYVLL